MGEKKNASKVSYALFFPIISAKTWYTAVSRKDERMQIQNKSFLFFWGHTIKKLKKSLDVFKSINLIVVHTVANHSLYTDVVLFFFSFFSKTSESARKNIPRAIF